MRTSDEIKTRLRYGAHELLQAQQVLATVSDRIQTAVDEIKVCNDRADLIDPAIDALNCQVHTLTEEMDRVYSLRNDESDLYLKQDNAKLKRDITALQHALRTEMEQHQAYLAESVKSDMALVRKVQDLESINNLLKKRLNEMRERYESAVIDLADQRDTIAGQVDTIRTLQSSSPFNLTANTTAATNGPSGGNAKGLNPFGQPVLETNRGFTATIKSSPASSPDKTSLNHSWLAQIPSSASFPFPNIAAQPCPTGLTPANVESTETAVRTPGIPKSRAIVRGTQEANESFERMKRSLFCSSLGNPTNIIDSGNDFTAPSSSPASGLAMTTTNPFGLRPITPSKEKSKLNPMVAAFTPSNSDGKGPAESGSMQGSSSSKADSKPPGTVTDSKEEGFISPHLRRLSKISIKEAPVTATEELTVKDGIHPPDTVATSDQNEFAKVTEPLQVTSVAPRILPHLRRQVQRSDKGKNKEVTTEENDILSRVSTPIGMKENRQAASVPGAVMRPDPGFQAWLDTQKRAQSNNASSREFASITNDALIDFDHDESPKAGEKKTTPLPPGFIPVSTNDAPAKPEKAFPAETDHAVPSVAVSDNLTSQNPALNLEEKAAADPKVSTKTTSEKDKNAAFLAEYAKQLNSFNSRYGRDSSDAKEDQTDPVVYGLIPGVPYYNPPRPTGTHELGSLLDDECSKMVLKPSRKGLTVQAHEQQQEWKAIRNKDGRVVYVL